MLKHSATNVKYIISMLICDNGDRQSQASLVPDLSSSCGPHPTTLLTLTLPVAAPVVADA